ncbi:MAG: Gfo/Idh/MocA family oxidoreductase [Spirochaeta sp.]|jgi:myo-inositol 2-dehydrogenase/D-chiro-inositol 1-dehydrogenase|nr:Gfo/Idh/MocA family oxidoreductase [Spirochaeta sp.]
MNEVRLGIVGLGRLGKRHAHNLRYRVPGARLVAACSVVPDELTWARDELGVENTYDSYDKMIASDEIDAVFLVSTSSFHGEQIKAGLAAGKHVFSEKPMGVTIEECHDVEGAVAAAPNLHFQLGFVRRFDPSLAYAKQKIDEGAIGEPFLVRAQTVDTDEFAEFQIKFVPNSGGIFMDMNSHDIDLARWFIGSEIKSVYAIGGSYVHPGFAEVNDADNTVALCQFENGKMAVISASRTAFHGHDTHTEITGSKGILKIGMTPSKNRVEIFDDKGARVECVQDFYERFHEGFLLEAQSFVNGIIDGVKPSIFATDGTRATEVGFALTQSFKEKRVVEL